MRLKELLEFDDIVIQCHNFPDADAIATGYAVYKYLTSNGKNARLIYSGAQKISKPSIVHMVEFLNIEIEYVTEEINPEALVMVDCYYGEGNVTKFPSQNIFIIDHHCHSGQIAYSAEIRNYASCSTVVAQMLKDEDFDYNSDKNLATALYFGLYTDSNGMDEISHPLDKNLRDLTKFDNQAFTILKNSNLSLGEMKIAGDALKKYVFFEEIHFAVVEAMPCDPNILGFISDLLLQVDKVDTCVVFCRMSIGIKLSVRSCVQDTRADELVKFLVNGVGNGGGHIQKAGGYMKIVSDNMSEYISSRVDEYMKSYKIMHAGKYDIDVSKMKKYTKKRLNFGYVRSTDIFTIGTDLIVRTLEADLNVVASDDIYIMIGIHGEAYPITRKKFEAGYEITDETFTSDAEYNPTVIDKSTLSARDILPYAKGCIANGSTYILARELQAGIKIYTAWDEENYMLGNPGDFLAARCDDLHDLYIIKRNIFFETYDIAE